MIKYPRTKEELLAILTEGYYDKYGKWQIRENMNVDLADIDTYFITDLSGIFINSNRTNFKGIEKWDTRR